MLFPIPVIAADARASTLQYLLYTMVFMFIVHGIHSTSISGATTRLRGWAGMKPPRFLEVGDVMSLGIDKLGEQRQRVVAYPANLRS